MFYVICGSMAQKATGTYPKHHSHEVIKCQDRGITSLSTLSIKGQYKEPLWTT